MTWNLWDEDADDRAEQRAVDAEIETAERSALEAIQQIMALVDRNPVLGDRAGRSALTHIATIAQAQGQTLFRRTLDRDQKRSVPRN